MSVPTEPEYPRSNSRYRVGLLRSRARAKFKHTGKVSLRWPAAVLPLSLLMACAQDPVSPSPEQSSSTNPTHAETDRRGAERSTPSPRRPTERGTTITAAGSDYGTVLFDATGQAVYLFDVETTAEPRCYGACADAWPPVLTSGDPQGGPRVQDNLLGTTRRTDGTTQVTYAGQPMYFYAHEGKHEVKCHDVFLNGGNWYAVQVDGTRAP